MAETRIARMSHDILNLPAAPADRRIAYGTDPEQFLDLRWSTVRAPEAGFPLVMNIHGGFWRAQYDLTHAGHLCAALTNRGLVTANLEYRRVGNEGGGWPGTFADICQAYDFLVEHAQEYTVDAGRVVITGHSAGGQLALCLAARRPRIRAVISLAGVLDLRRAYELHLSDDAVVEFLGGTPREVPERYREADPIHLAINRSRQMLFHGTLDQEVPIHFSRDYVTKKATDENVKLVELPGVGHYELIDPRTDAWRLFEKTLLSLLKCEKLSD
jgi:acetyl esterase/lipase